MTDADTFPDVTRVFRELLNDLDNDRSLVLLCHGYTELLVNAIVAAKCNDNQRRSHRKQLSISRKRGLLSDSEHKALDSFRDLRNRAAHQPIFRLEEKDWNNLEVTKKCATPKDVFVQIWVDLFNLHSECLGPIFLPSFLRERSYAQSEIHVLHLGSLHDPNAAVHSSSPSDKDSNQSAE